MDKKFYFVIAVALLISMGFMLTSIQKFHFSINITGSYNWSVLLFPVFFILLHTAKASRLYLILLESRLPFYFFLFLYGVTALITIALPYKIGEVFRMYCFGLQLKHMGKGILSILVDRYFDTLGLLLLLLPLEIYYDQGLSGISLFLLLFLSLLVLSYYAFPTVYVYLNSYLVFRVHSRKGILALRILENINLLYCNIQFLMKQRTPLLILLSFFSWLCELGALAVLLFLYENHDLGWSFISYLSSLIGNEDSNVIFHSYLLLDGCLMVFFLIGIMVHYYRKAKLTL